MKKYWLTGLLLAAGLGMAGAADAQIKFGVACRSPARTPRLARS